MGRCHDANSCGPGDWEVMGKSAQALWQDYHFLTQEMVKFLTKQDMSLFYVLMEQRGRLQTSIEKTEDEAFKESAVGRALLIEIQKQNQFLIDHLQSRMSRSKGQFQVMKAYSGVNNGATSRMTWKR